MATGLYTVNSLVSYEKSDEFVTITMDDGKVNVMSMPMMTEINQALDQAEADGAVVILTGRQGIFSAGFDLSVFRQGPERLLEMMTTGAELAGRVMAFPTPVVTACNGHAYPMGAFLMLSADIRIGAEGPYRIGMNEVAIGITVPLFAIEIAKHRLTPAYFSRAVVNAEMFSPDAAIAAGFLDRVVPEEELLDASKQSARYLCGLDMASYRATKTKAKGSTLTGLRHAIETELTLDR
jgi:enoyl-CoA hydratase